MVTFNLSPCVPPAPTHTPTHIRSTDVGIEDESSVSELLINFKYTHDVLRYIAIWSSYYFEFTTI